MRKFVLEEMLLMSMREQAAKRIKFHPDTTIIVGANDTGKSSLLKSIYWTFGAQPPDVNEDWKKARVTSLVKFTVDGTRYYILRSENVFGLFDSKQQLIGTYTSVTKQLGPKLAELFDFKITLTNKQGEEIIPPPAYFFLPFYIDQDDSWHENWSSFENLRQLSNWRRPLVEYHTGIRTNEYYTLKAEVDRLQLKIHALEHEREFLTDTWQKVKSEVDAIEAIVDIEMFKKEIEDLMYSLQGLQVNREKFKHDLVQKYNQGLSIQAEIDIVQNALSEVKADKKFASKHENIDCPTCGHTYSNSFAERFSIAQDEYTCADLLVELRNELIALNESIRKSSAEYAKYENEVSDIQAVLNRKKGQLSLQDVIKSEGKRQMKNYLIEKIGVLDLSINNLSLSQKDFVDKQKALKKRDHERKERILEMYRGKMRSYLGELDVNRIGEDSYSAITFNVKESGSDRPRALLAYYYSILDVMREFTSAVFAPVVIDSPNQQDQDGESLIRMLKFIRDRKMNGAQLILGLTDFHDIDYGGSKIELKDKYRLLNKIDFKKIFDEVNPLLDKCLI